jgi:Zn/Cd-binding protein ZinT
MCGRMLFWKYVYPNLKTVYLNFLLQYISATEPKTSQEARNQYTLNYE